MGRASGETGNQTMNKFHKRYVLIQEEIEKACAIHGRRLAILDKKLHELQSECNHLRTVYHSDPAGDSADSYYQCVYCKKRL